MIWHSEDLTAISRELGSDTHSGLTAEQAEERQREYGPNKLDEKPPRPCILRFLDQFKDVMVLILIGAAAVSLGLSVYNALQGREADWAEPIVILVIVVVNALLGVIQESRAQAALEALKNLSAPAAKVWRDGVLTSMKATDLVPGDVVEFEAGDLVPADCRLLSAASLQVDESALTGESVPVLKDAGVQIADIAPLGDRVNMAYAGCAVSYGRGRALVVETGMRTEMGKIAALLENEGETVTPLQRKLAQLGKYLGILALVICAVIFVVGLLDGLDPLDMFMTAVSLAVAAIPEGLPAIVTIVLAIGVQRMVTKNAIIRRLPAVETLGSASVICSDKTGTLTQNRMTLVKVFAGDRISDAEGDVPEGVLALLRLAALCTDGTVREENGMEIPVGDPTETAIVACALHHGLRKEELTAEQPRVVEIPFDSDRKLMTTVHLIEGKTVAIVKGAPDILLNRCTAGKLQEAAAANEEMGRQALRVLAIGYKYLDEVPVDCRPEELEQGLTFAGLVGMIDPPRPEAMEAIKVCDGAGIRTVMITGDHVITASAIARQLGILHSDDEAVTGEQLAAMSDEELRAGIRKFRVYARVTPADKIRIVKAWQEAGEIVSMTGDGVNDAPALKAADICCAMGITGTDVAKGAADMTLTDDNFATIVTAVKEGRGIFDNIRKAVHFLLSCNLGEILTVFGAMMLWRESPLMPMQLLWINLVTDGLPALALGMEPVEYDVMTRPPRKKEESIFAHGLGAAAIWQGLLVGLLA
ncbi:MAG: HAD-IC family P-type ATPase, partial [Oscillospiraceae bacterium]|nr:HAD-IC family P-type ATPase [Oscillospiraceae bacterium]